jgi:hypothetical protein
LARRLIEVLRILAKEFIEEGYDAPDVLEKIQFSEFSDIDILALREELIASEASQRIEEAEIDTMRVFLAYLLLKDTELGIDEIYTFIFGQGKQIVWH